MACWLMVLGFMVGAAAFGYMLAYFLQPATQAKPSGSNSNEKGNNPNSSNDAEKAQRELDKMKKRYDELYDSKLDVDTALVTAESTLDGLKMDYERMEREMSGNNNRTKELQSDFDRYKDNKETEIKELRAKTKMAHDGYETVKFQLAKSNRISEKLQESLVQLKEENEKLSEELLEANGEIDLVNEAMSELKLDYKTIKEKAETYNEKLAAWHEKYESLDLVFKQVEEDKSKITTEFENYKSSSNSEIERLSLHLEDMQTQLEETTTYTNEYADAYSQSEEDRLRLFYELEEQKKQAAQELEEIQNNFKDLEKNYHEIQNREEVLDDRFESLQAKHTDLEEAYLSTVEEKENLEVAYKEYTESAIEEFAELENNAKNWVEKLESSNYELAQHKEKAASLEENKKQLMQELEKTRQRYEKELSLSGGEFEALNDTFEDLKKRYFDLNKELSTTKLEKERIGHENETLQEEVFSELQSIRLENKKLAKSLADLKAEKRSLEFSKEELLERISQLEENSTMSPVQGQEKLVKVINRLQKNIEEYQTDLENTRQKMDDFQKEKVTYEEKIRELESKLAKQVTIVNYSDLEEETSKVTKEDLTQINGIGKAVQRTLNDFGVYNFEQLANISTENKDLLCQIIATPVSKIEKWAEIARDKFL